MRVALKPIVGPLVLAAVLLMGDVVPADAQFARQRADERLQDQIQRLEREVQDLQRYVYNNPPPAEVQGPAAPSSGSVGLDGNLPAAAILTQRVDSLDASVRTLTGEVEQLNFRVNQLSQQLERVMGDFDYRLRSLEGGGAPLALGENSPYASTFEPQLQGDVMEIAAAPITTGDVDVGFAGAPVRGVGAPQSLGMVTASRLSGSEEADFEIGMQLLRQGDFAGAEATFLDFIGGYPESGQLGAAHFWLGETLYVRGLYADAANSYLTSARDFGDGEKAADSLLKLGMALSALGQTDQACSAFDQVARSYPDASSRVTRNVARERTANSCS